MKRGRFNHNHYKLMTGMQGKLYPIGWSEVLPGDSIQHAISLLLRTSALNAPVMHPVQVRVHNWFVPYRLLWTAWEDFITGGPNGADASVFPTMGVTNAATGSLWDHLGVPTGVGNNLVVSALPLRAYAMIFNEWYRDQDLVAELPMLTSSGSDATTNVDIQSVAWEKDYFTSARPWAQKGTAVSLPLGTSAPVVSTGVTPTFKRTGGTDRDLRFLDTPQTLAYSGAAETPQNAFFGAVTGLETDLSTATSATINAIRLAMAVQRYQEARARFGSRYTEYLRYLGVKSSDARLMRPEYLSGAKQTIQFSEVLQTGVGDDFSAGNGVGFMRGHGIGTARSNRYRRFFEEHGLVMSLLSVKPRTVYMDGLARKWNRRTRTDFWQKELQHVGQQEILKKEIYAQGTSVDEETWGYQDRYDDLRRTESSVHGGFRTTYNYWHMARDFASLPTLNASFINADPTTRIYQETAADQLYVMAYHSMQMRRLLDQSATPFVF